MDLVPTLLTCDVVIYSIMDDAGEIEEAGRVVNGVCTRVYFVCVCRRPKLATVCCIGPDHIFELYVTSSRLDAVQCVREGEEDRRDSFGFPPFQLFMTASPGLKCSKLLFSCPPL